jgi:Asp-tRNA(Asn)/Glu-tRNA(Gln) amidotransferase A subunit family amidase
MGRSLADCYLLLRAQVGADRRDPFTAGPPPQLPDHLPDIDLSSIRAAISADLGCAPIDADIRAVFEERIQLFCSAFAAAEERDPDLGQVHEAFEVLRGVHFVAAHREKLQQHRDRLGPNVVDNTDRGLAYSLADVAWATGEQGRIYQNFCALFDEVDVLICPAAAASPFPHQQLYPEKVNGERMPTYMRWLALTYGLTMALPAACCLPCGVDRQGMPFGIQVVGPNGADAKVLQVATALERVLASRVETSRPVVDPTRLSAAGPNAEGHA